MGTELNKRGSYERGALDERSAGDDPLALFHDWLHAAEQEAVPEHNAMVLGTTGPDGPSSRVVLLRSFDAEGFTFFTNYNSRKAIDLEHDARAALLFFWPQLERQVRIEGRVARVAAHVSDAYFATRPRGSRIGAWASDQSARIRDREALDEKYLRWQERFLDDAVPRPVHWGGYCVAPARIEFWQGRADRMHDRMVFTREADGTWSRGRMQP